MKEFGEREKLQWYRGERAQYSSAEAACEMASPGRVTPNCFEKKRLNIMACILPPPTKPLSHNGRENIQ